MSENSTRTKEEINYLYSLKGNKKSVAFQKALKFEVVSEWIIKIVFVFGACLQLASPWITPAYERNWIVIILKSIFAAIFGSFDVCGMHECAWMCMKLGWL